MFELFVLIIFGWLFVKAIGLAFKVSWGLAKILAVILFVLSLPTLIGCLLMASGIILMIPIALIGTAFGLLRACV